MTKVLGTFGTRFRPKVHGEYGKSFQFDQFNLLSRELNEKQFFCALSGRSHHGHKSVFMSRAKVA